MVAGVDHSEDGGAHRLLEGCLEFGGLSLGKHCVGSFLGHLDRDGNLDGGGGCKTATGSLDLGGESEWTLM